MFNTLFNWQQQTLKIDIWPISIVSYIVQCKELYTSIRISTLTRRDNILILMHASPLLTSTSMQSLLYNWSLQSSTYCLSVSKTLATTTNLRQFRSVSLPTYSPAETYISCFVPKNGENIRNYTFKDLISNRTLNNFKQK